MKLGKSPSNESMKGSEQFKYKTIPESEAVDEIRKISLWMQDVIGVDTQSHFREVMQETLTGEAVPLFSYIPNIEVSDNYPHYWVYSTPQNRFDIPNSNPFTYFPSYQKALKLHNENQKKGLDSYMRGASGISLSHGQTNYIRRELFIDSFAYGVITSTHEPFHRFIYDTLEIKTETESSLNESLATYFGYETALLYSQYISSTNPEVATAIKQDIERSKGFDLFARLNYFRLNTLYEKNNQQKKTTDKNRRRTSEEDKLIKEMQRLYMFFLPANLNVELFNKTNNAYIKNKIAYTEEIIIGDFFKMHNIDFMEFISNADYHNQYIGALRAYYYDSKDVPPVDIDQQYNSLVSRLESGQERRIFNDYLLK